MIEIFECKETNDCNIRTKDYWIIIRGIGSNGFFMELFDNLKEKEIAKFEIKEAKKCEK